jgi:hypothetical protein
LGELDAHLSQLASQTQFVPSLRQSDKVGEPLANVIEKDVAGIANAYRLPTQEPEFLIETRRKVRNDFSRDLTRTRTHTELIASRGIHVDVNAYLFRPAPPRALVVAARCPMNRKRTGPSDKGSEGVATFGRPNAPAPIFRQPPCSVAISDPQLVLTKLLTKTRKPASHRLVSD